LAFFAEAMSSTPAVREDDGIEAVDLTIHEPAIKCGLARSKPSKYSGCGTPDDPFVVEWDLADLQNPYNWSKLRKWVITAQVVFHTPLYTKLVNNGTLQMAMSTFSVSFGSSSYTGGIQFVMADLHISEEVALLGVTVYVIGFALG
jgi:hypothetical protein